MIKNREEALELCKKYEVDISKHNIVIITENNNIYLSDNIDPKDIGNTFYLKGGPEENQEPTKEEPPLDPEKSEEELALEKEIEEEEAAKKAAPKEGSKKSK